MAQRSITPGFVLKNGIHGLGVFSTMNFKCGDVLFRMTGQLIKSPTRTSVQIGDNLHIEDALAGFVNHSCAPNARIDRHTHCFIAMQDIAVDDEVMFDYNANEDCMASPFVCECCQKNIAGGKRGW